MTAVLFEFLETLRIFNSEPLVLKLDGSVSHINPNTCLPTLSHSLK